MASSTSVSRPSLRPERQIPLRNSTNGHPPVRSKVPTSKRSVTPNARPSSSHGDDSEPARVRVSVRLRPRNAEDHHSDADFADCVELQPELKRLKLRKNNWNFESFKFDEVFTESASQKRVYEVVAKPVVESVLNGYNGTVMAYGQTGTGKTYTLGRLGKDDPSERGIMVRALEDIFASTSSFDTVEVSYLQLYLESLQDLLMPEKNNIPIAEDPKTGEVSLPGATIIKVRDLNHFLQLLLVGEANRHAANTKMNTESSRSHAILMVYIQKSSQGKVENETSPLERDSRNGFRLGTGVPTLLRSKLLIVDLAGSERLDKSGSEGHMLEEAKFINLSLTALGKCINALAENGPHIPTRDSKLTRLLRDSFGGSARTSLIITIGPSARHHAETASTVMFGQRAMKVVNMVKLKEEFDYESLCRKLDNQVDYLTAEVERQQKLREDDKEEIENKLRGCQNTFAESEKRLIASSELLKKEKNCLEAELKNVLDELKLHKDHNDLMHNEVVRLEMTLEQSKQNHLENSTYQEVLADTTQMYEKKIAELFEQLEAERARSESAQEQLSVVKKTLSDHQACQIHGRNEIDDLRIELEDTRDMHEKVVNDFQSLQTQNEELLADKIEKQSENDQLRMKLREMCQLHKKTADEFQLWRTKNEQLMSKIQEENEVEKLRIKLQEMSELHESTVSELELVKKGNEDLLSEKAMLIEELYTMRQKLSVEEKQRKYLEDESLKLKKLVSENDRDSEEKKFMNENITIVPSGMAAPMSLHKEYQPRETSFSQKATIAKIFEEVGLEKIIAMLGSEDLEVQIHAVKVVANLAAEDTNQENIVEEGGLDALLMLLESSQNTTIYRVASGAIANLAMSEMNQVLIMSKGGARLLANVASKTDDPQTLRMVAGAFANLCGNQKLHVMLKEDGGIRALLGMVRSGNIDVIAQVARGMANFAKCESRGTIHGHRKGRSLLLEDGALAWLIANSTINSSSTRRHIELALCHLAQNGDNAWDFVSSGAVNALVCISRESSREDIRSLARKTLNLNPMFQAEMHNVTR